MPSFTVIIPCYNAEASLEATLATLRNQSTQDWEAILVDDGSTDNTPALLREAACEEPRFRLLHQTNQGPSKARNAALAFARGTYIAFLDADDLWHPDKLATHLDFFEAYPETDVAFARIAFFKEDPDQPSTFSTVPDHPLSVVDLLRENKVCTMSNLVVRKNAITALGGLNENMVHGEDRQWLVRAAASGLTINGINQVLVHYRATVTGLSANLDAMYAGWRMSVETALNMGYEISKLDRRQAEAVYLRYMARRALRLDQPGFIAAAYALKGISLSPSAFLKEVRRGLPTLLGSLSAPFLPTQMRHALFAD